MQKQNIVLPEQRLSFVDSPFHMETFLKAARYAFINEPLYYYYQDNPEQSVKDDRHISDIIATNDFSSPGWIKHHGKIISPGLFRLLSTTFSGILKD